MKKTSFIAALLFTSFFVVSLKAEETAQPGIEKQDILRRDQIDPTSVLAIPLDDSEIEDEYEINRGEKKEVFNLPHSR